MSRKHIDKSAKYEILCLAGTRCMFCGEDVGSEITWHHLKPRYAGGTDTLDNSSLLCGCCHRIIHQYEWGTSEYTQMTKIILANRNAFVGRTLPFSFK